MDQLNHPCSHESDIPIRVLQIFRSLHPDVGGPLSYLMALRNAPDKSPFETTVVAFDSIPEPSGTIPVYPAPNSPTILKVGRLAVWLIGHLKHFDLVHIHGMYGWHTVFTSLACLWMGKPYILSTHGHLSAYALSQKRLKKRIYLACLGRRIMRHANMVVATTEIEKKAILAVEPHAKTTVVLPGIQLPDTQDVSAHKSDRLELLFLGRLHPHKQVPLLLEALAQIKHIQPNWRLSIVGTGDPGYVVFLQRQAQELELMQQVDFLGYLAGDRKEKVLRQSDLLLLPSRSENFSFAVAEALAHGVPAIVTSEVGLADYIRDFGCGAVVPVNDVKALSQAILYLGQDKQLRQAAKAARSCAEHIFPLQRMHDGLHALYVCTRLEQL